MSYLQSIAAITAIAGIITIIFLSNALEPKEISIGNIDRTMIGEYVKVVGEISNIKHSTVTSFTIRDHSSEIYAFSYENIDLNNGRYGVIGKVNEYHGSLEIEINKMENIE